MEIIVSCERIIGDWKRAPSSFAKLKKRGGDSERGLSRLVNHEAAWHQIRGRREQGLVGSAVY